MYNPLQPNSLYPMLNNLYQQVQPLKQTIVRVNGRNGAEAYNLGPDSSALLLDNNDPIIWFISTDGAGYKTCIPYDISPHKEENTDINSLLQTLNSRLTTIEERMNIKNESNSTTAKSNTATSNANWNFDIN